MISKDAERKLKELSEDSILFEIDDEGNPVSWVIIIPTTEELLRKFLDKEISERELFEQTQPSAKYTALYLCSSITVPEHRNKGHALRLMLKAINRFKNMGKLKLFAWPATPEGFALVKELEKQMGQKIYLRQDSACG